MEEPPSLVFDCGTLWSKVGIAGDETPKSRFLTTFARRSSSDFVVGDDTARGTWPIERGHISKFDDMVPILTHSFRLLGFEVGQHPVVLTDSLAWTRDDREKTASVMFETIGAPALFLGTHSYLAYMSSGRSSALICDVGAGLLQVVPLLQGRQYETFTQGVHLRLAGSDVDFLLNKNLSRQWRGTPHQRLLTPSFVRSLKEEHAFCRLNGQDDVEEELRLPDGATVGPERYSSSDVLFKPRFVGKSGHGIRGIPEVIESIVRKFKDEDDINMLYNNIVLSGGGSLLRQFPEKLEEEMRRRLPNQRYLHVVPGEDRANMPWIGGSIMASLSTFQNQWLTRQEFEDVGPGGIHRVFFM